MFKIDMANDISHDQIIVDLPQEYLNSRIHQKISKNHGIFLINRTLNIYYNQNIIHEFKEYGSYVSNRKKSSDNSLINVTNSYSILSESNNRSISIIKSNRTCRFY